MVIQVVLTLVVGLAFGLPYLFLICLFAALCMPIPFVGSALALVLPSLSPPLSCPAQSSRSPLCSLLDRR